LFPDTEAHGYILRISTHIFKQGYYSTHRGVPSLLVYEANYRRTVDYRSQLFVDLLFGHLTILPQRQAKANICGLLK